MRLICAVLGLLLAACGDTAPEKAAVRETFTAYQSALLNNDGPLAASLLSTQTVKAYGDAISMALNAPETEVRALAFIDRILVLRVRAEFTPERIRQMSGLELLEHAIENGWIDKESTAKLEVHSVAIRDGFAALRLKVGKQKVPFAFEVHRQDGVWKLDLSSTFKPINKVLLHQAAEAGVTENEMIHQMFEFDGIDGGLTNDLWRPVDAPAVQTNSRKTE